MGFLCVECDRMFPAGAGMNRRFWCRNILCSMLPPENLPPNKAIRIIATLVHREGKVHEVNLLGETVAVVTLSASQVRPAHKREIAHMQDLASSTPWFALFPCCPGFLNSAWVHLPSSDLQSILPFNKFVG